MRSFCHASPRMARVVWVLSPQLARLRAVLTTEGLDDDIEMVNVPDAESARQEGFLGSPSIQINGLDIEADRRADPPCYGCRVYANGEPVPPEDLIRTALRRSVGPKLKVLFLCTGNSCRSQMAEGWARHLKGDVINAYSAGIETHGLNPNAVKVMAEAGVDISGHKSKRVDEVEDVVFDYVVTVCGHANETCPMWLKGKAKVVHVGFGDPPALARELAAKGFGEQVQLDCYRRVRDEIRAFVESLPNALESKGVQG
jgi:arsenate reductase